MSEPKIPAVSENIKEKVFFSENTPPQKKEKR